MASQVAINRWVGAIRWVETLKLSQQFTLPHGRISREGTIPVVPWFQIWLLMQIIAIVDSEEDVTECSSQLASCDVNLPMLMNGLQRLGELLANVFRKLLPAF